jgi:hypothetical protein
MSNNHTDPAEERAWVIFDEIVTFGDWFSIGIMITYTSILISVLCKFRGIKISYDPA